MQAEKQPGKPAGDIYYLKYKIISNGMNISDAAAAMGITKQNLYRKIGGKTEWSLKDIKRLKLLLQMTDEEVKKVFDL